MIVCVDRVREKEDKFLDTIYKSNPKNEYVKSDTIDILNKSPFGTKLPVTTAPSTGVVVTNSA